MSIVLANVTRGNIVESIHRGSIAVTDGDGKLLAYAGDPYMVSFIRSSSKPLQALNSIFTGAAEHYGFTDTELAIMCGSHYGEPEHKEVVYSILDKIGCTTKDLLCGAQYSIDNTYMRKQLAEHHAIDEVNCNCSAKHCSFMAACKMKGYPLEGYNQPDHPVQRDVLDIVAHMCGMAAEDIDIGIDGCTVPVHGMPLVNMAIAYARLATPSQLDEPYRSACSRIYQAMADNPWMIAGTGGFCTEFMKHTHGRFCGKLGAESVYTIGVKDKNIGIAVKIDDGSYRPLYAVVISVLKQLNLLDDSEIEALSQFAEPEILNILGQPVGKVVPCFELEGL